MDVTLEPEWHPATKLNAIAGEVDVAATDPLPKGVSRDRIEEICYTLRTLYGEYVDAVAETTLSRREAQTWVLRNLSREGAERLSYEAIGLYIWAIGRATEGDPLSRTIVSEYADRAARKIARAETTVMRTGPPPYPDEVYDEPTPLWVGSDVAGRLRDRVGSGEPYDDLIERLLDETRPTVTAAALVAAYREQRDADYVAVETVYPDWDADLRFVIRAPEGETPAAVADAAAVTVDGRPYSLTVTEEPDPAPARSHLVVFAAGDDEDGGGSVGDGRDEGGGEGGGGSGGDGDADDRSGTGVAPEAGLCRLRSALETVELDLPAAIDRLRAAGVQALAVGNEPAGAGAHLYPIVPGDGTGDIATDDTATDEGVADGDVSVLAHLERLALDDRTLRVGRISPVTAREHEDVAAETTLLWATDAAGIGRSQSLPDDPAERRERFPARVLRTAT